MITITDKEEIMEFLKIINDINQELKTIYKSENWINRNGRCISCIKGQLPSLVDYTYDSSNLTKKRIPIAEKVISDYIRPTVFMIQPKEFFSLFKDYKNDIEEIIITENEIVFKTITIEKVFPFEPKKIRKEEIQTGDLIAEIQAPSNFAEKIIEFDNTVFNMVLLLDSNEVVLNPNMKELVNSDLSYLSVKLNKKFIIGVRNKYKKLKAGLKPDDISNITIKLYETDEESKFVLQINIVNKDCMINSFYGVTDF